VEASMIAREIARRLEILERKVDVLEQLPARIDRLELQIVQLRQEMRDEFSAMRMEMRSGDEETRNYMRVLYEDLVTRISTLGESR
jgi:S-adenosylmethionine synthetase